MSILIKLVSKVIPRLNSLHYKDKYDLIYPNKNSKEGLVVPLIVLEYGGGRPRFALKTMPYMLNESGN